MIVPFEAETRAAGHVLETDGVRIVYDVIGVGPPVLLLHGGGADSSWWGPLVPRLAQNHAVIAMDSRGHGRSSFDCRQITYRTMADDTLALLDHLDIDLADIVGWSDGAIIALDIALRFPARLGKVVAYGVNFDLGGFRRGNEDAEPDPDRAELYAEFPRRYQEQSPHPERWDELMSNMRATWTTEPNWTPDEMRSIPTTMLVLHGVEEEVIDIDHARLLAELLPNGRLCLMPGTGHFAMYDQPDEFTRIVADYIDGES